MWLWRKAGTNEGLKMSKSIVRIDVFANQRRKIKPCPFSRINMGG